MPRLVSSTLYVSISVSLSIAQQARRVCAQKLERRSSHDLSTTNCPFPMLSCGPCAALKCLLQSCKQSVLNVVLYWNGAHGTRSHRIFLTRLMICPCSNASISAQLPMPVIIIQIYERVWKHVLVRTDLSLSAERPTVHTYVVWIHTKCAGCFISVNATYAWMTSAVSTCKSGESISCINISSSRTSCVHASNSSHTWSKKL